ncbi:hypothetical protein Dsin_019271 [Dipteronia sinensis]|uniref:MULE transposase domain-containing protein n=1 Tax=Dipteronia sinensis TaxID=43782 RepID=A0AAE0E2K9_9ROSI|nr:hypothetical protein Dsin_019271 [Dipteronia sinensis]
MSYRWTKLFNDELQERFTVKVDNQTIYRSNRIVLETLKINHSEAYVKLKRYGNTILTMNPMSDVKVSMDPNVILDNPSFFKFYFSFDACKTSFVNSCGSLIGVDGCHLSGQFGRVLLSTTTLDGDNNILPIAICIYEFENSDSWTWFLRDLRDSWDRMREERIEIYFISDREYSVQAANWMMKKPVEKWARHAFQLFIKADHISNNMSECFNSWIREDKDKPVLQLLENLRRKIMMNGLPCMHAIDVYMYNREFPHNHGHWFYSKEAWKLTYDGVINPIPDESRWPEFQSETIEPPMKRTKEKGKSSTSIRKMASHKVSSASACTIERA